MSLNESRNVLKRLANMLYENRLEYVWKLLKLNEVDKSCLFLALVVLLSNGNASLNTKVQKEPTTTELSLDDAYSADSLIDMLAFEDGYVEENVKVVKNMVDESVRIAKETISPEAIIMQKYNLTEEEFMTVCAVVLSEAAANSYDDAYAVINTIWNRTKSINFINSVNNKMGRDDADSLYVQVICPGQFEVYDTGRYMQKWGVTDEPGYQAIIDFLLTEEPMHNYLYFVGQHCKKDNSVQFVERGNKYFGELKEDDRILTLERSLNS